MAVLSSSTLELYCWTGKYNDKPSSPQYSITKINPDSNNTIRFELSELIQDYVDLVFTNNYTKGNIKSTCWWSYDKRNEYSDLSYPTFENAYGIATKGYAYFENGLNSSLSTSKLISNEYLYIPENGTIRFPVYVGSTGVTSVKFYSKSAAGTEFVSDTKGFNILSNIPSTEDSNDYIRYVESGVNATKIEITSTNLNIESGVIINNTTARETIYPVYLDCSKYENYKISFVNKFGAIQDLWFNKKRTDDLNVKRDSFNTSTIYSSTSSVSYNTYDPTTIIQDVTSKKSITLNTGYLKDEYNETIRQLMQSEDIWITEGSNTLPVAVKDSSFKYKTHLNDKLVNYTVQFDYAFDSINTVR